jgi:N6-L-threonylcarbamoyladenine synthase
VGSLLVGLSLGKALAFSLDKPFFAVHHLEGHLYSPLLSDGDDAAESPPDRFVALVVSGGHTSLYKVVSGEIEPLSETRDDAMGEVFDKVGKRLGLPYPQCPEVDRLAEEGEASRHPMPVPRCGESLDFSYSGLKTRALMDLEKLERQGIPPDSPQALDLLAGFRAAAVGQILNRLERLHKKEPIPFLAVSGGAAANRLLRREVDAWASAEDVDLRLVPLRYAGDNAAMIAHAALLRSRRGEEDDPLAAEAASRIPMA